MAAPLTLVSAPSLPSRSTDADPTIISDYIVALIEGSTADSEEVLRATCIRELDAFIKEGTSRGFFLDLRPCRRPLYRLRPAAHGCSSYSHSLTRDSYSPLRAHLLCARVSERCCGFGFPSAVPVQVLLASSLSCSAPSGTKRTTTAATEMYGFAV